MVNQLPSPLPEHKTAKLEEPLSVKRLPVNNTKSYLDQPHTSKLQQDHLTLTPLFDKSFTCFCLSFSGQDL